MPFNPQGLLPWRAWDQAHRLAQRWLVVPTPETNPYTLAKQERRKSNDTMTYPTLLLEEQMQHERLDRAQAALHNGDMTVLPVTADTWSVASRGRCYTVRLEGATWSCTCRDFAIRCQRFGLLCKHIEAVRSIDARQIAEAGDTGLPDQSHVQNMEEVMTQTSASMLGLAVAPPSRESPPGDEVIWRLRQPLDMNRVKRRQAPGKGTVPYLEGFSVIEAANDLFGFRWSFDLLSDPQVMRWDRVITFYDQKARKKVPVMGEDGKPQTEIAGIVYQTGKVIIELEGKAYTHADVGRCIFSGDTPEALDMAIAGAATDCLKRCFRQLGEQFGLSLYDKDIAKTAGLDTEGRGNTSESNPPRSSQPEPQPSPAAPTNTKPAQPPAAPIPPESLQYRDGTPVEMSNPAEVTAFNSFKTVHSGLAPATRDVLRAWTARSNGKK